MCMYVRIHTCTSRVFTINRFQVVCPMNGYSIKCMLFCNITRYGEFDRSVFFFYFTYVHRTGSLK